MTKRHLFSCLFMAFFLSSCARDNQGQTIGTLGGGAIGALLGSQVGGGRGRVWATGVGAVLGAMMGSQIGAAIDERDRAIVGKRTCDALESAPTGEKVAWNNPDTGNYGEIIPQQASYDPEGRPCRKFTQVAFIDGKKVLIHGMAYRGADGQWHMVQQ